MRGINAWSYAPYRPFFKDVGDIYICRVAPSEQSICFAWLPLEEEAEYTVCYRKRGEDAFLTWGRTTRTDCEIEGLLVDTDYEFFVTCGEKRSRIRLARCGEGIGNTVHYLHPDDEAYAFSGRYLCSPSLLKHPDGYLLASMDVYAANHPQNLTLIFRSDDGGESWYYLSELMPCFWGKLFLCRGEVYMLACSTEYGDLLISKSTDGGKSFLPPVTLFRGSNGKNGGEGVHKNPQNIIIKNGRLYNTMEWGSWANKDYCHAAMVMSCDLDDDLLNPSSWSFSEPRRFDHFSKDLTDLPLRTMTIEGTLVIDPKGMLFNIMRFGKYGKAIVYEVDQTNPHAPLSYARLMDFPANLSKFMIKRDEVSGRYFSIATRLYDPEKPKARNLLSLMASKDLITWEVVCDLYDFRDRDHKLVGLQYVDFEFDGEDIIYLCRTAINGANTYHNSNYVTFHKIERFRDLMK